MAKTASVPARKKPGHAVAAQKSTQFIDVLKTDHSYDVIDAIVKEIGFIGRSKKIKPLDKRRLLKDYNLALLSYCVPKMRVVEDNSDKNAKPMNFQINIGGPAPAQPGPGQKPNKGNGSVSITIPTKKNKDGSFSVDDTD